MLAKGSKVESPHVRATGKNGTIHAVARDGGGRSLCGRVTVAADEPVRRFQQGLGNECVGCTGKVVEARLAAIQSRKALRSKKNQPTTPVVAKNVTRTPKAPVTKKAPAKSSVVPIKPVAKKAPAKKSKAG